MTPNPSVSLSSRVMLLSISTILILSVLSWVFGYAVSSAYEAPDTFPTDETISIVEGMTAKETAAYLKERGAIKSVFAFTHTLEDEFPGLYIQAGTYSFSEPLAVTELVEALVTGSYSTPDIKATFPEGFRIADIPLYLPDTVQIDTDIEEMTEEGYLFPDTYHLESDTTLSELIARMRENFDIRIAPLQDRIDASLFTREEVIILASIIEREANDPISMKMVSGILQNRLALDMPLQVDAVFEYLLGKTSAELTLEDLELDSPYNTYTNPGLPPTPIANPGLTSILAVLEPTTSDYLYYLTGDDGKFYYARTFEEHKVNKARYLR